MQVEGHEILFHVCFCEIVDFLVLTLVRCHALRVFFLEFVFFLFFILFIFKLSSDNPVQFNLITVHALI